MSLTKRIPLEKQPYFTQSITPVKNKSTLSEFYFKTEGKLMNKTFMEKLHFIMLLKSESLGAFQFC